jgi:thiamine-monophosphate kinase
VPHRPSPISTKPQPLGELALIAAIRQRTSGTTSKSVRLGIGDDCAILMPPARHELLVTTDFSLEGRHFRRDWHPAASAGYRTLARGLSDLASMGAKPLAAFLSLALPRSVTRKPSWVNDFLDGLLTLADIYKVPLAGGDTSESPSDHVLADILLLGTAPTGRALRRSAAKAGDTLYVTGSLGGAATELAALAASPRSFRKASASGDHPHLFPQPRLAVGQALLRRRLATACIDLSDGLSTDLAHLCDESQVTAQVEAAKIPLHPLTRTISPAEALHNALHGGEDYELLFTAHPGTAMPRSIAGVRITPIGVILPVKKGIPQVTLVEAAGRRSTLAPQGWQHLK